MIINRTPLALIATSALLLLAGCSGGATTDDAASTNDSGSEDSGSTTQETTAPAADQSKAGACQIVQTQFEEVSSAGSSLDSSDPQGAIDSFKELASNVDTQFASITNEEVAPAAQKASGALNDYVTFLEGILADPSTASGLSEQVTTLQEGFTEAATVCAG